MAARGAQDVLSMTAHLDMSSFVLLGLMPAGLQYAGLCATQWSAALW